MARITIVELLDHRGHVRSRTRLETLPASVGRGYDNDVIVDDPFVSPRHLRLFEDEAGTLWAEDAGSTNGTRRTPRGSPEPRFAVPSGAMIVIGKTTLRVFDANHQVPVALPQHRDDATLAEVLSHPRNTAVVAAVVTLFFAGQGYINSTTREVGERMVTMALGVLTLTAIWAGLWALIGRITHAGAKYRAHLGWACVGAVVLTLVSTLLGWLQFAVPSNEAVEALAGIILAATLAVYLAGHITMASSLAPRQALRRTVIGFGAAALVVTLVMLTSRDEFSPVPEFPTTLASLPGALLDTQGIDDFAAQTLKLQKEVDELARKRERASLIPSALKTH